MDVDDDATVECPYCQFRSTLKGFRFAAQPVRRDLPRYRLRPLTFHIRPEQLESAYDSVRHLMITELSEHHGGDAHFQRSTVVRADVLRYIQRRCRQVGLVLTADQINGVLELETEFLRLLGIALPLAVEPPPPAVDVPEIDFG